MSARPLTLALGACLAGCAEAPYEPDWRVDELRPTALDAGVLPPHFDPGERVERVASPSGAFAVHFTRRGRNAVPAEDGDSDGVPDYVTLTARTFDEALAHEAGRMFRPPVSDEGTADNGGDARFDVYLVDFARRADGAFRLDACDPASAPTCPGHMLVENDFAGYAYPSARVALRTVASHELFHAVQAAYRLRQGIVVEEATAVWATERFDPALDDLERLASRYLDAPDRALDQDPAGPPDGFSYGAALFFEHETLRHGDAVVRELWEAIAARGAPEEPWLVALDVVLRERHHASFADDFARFATWNLYTGSAADPTRAWPRGAALARVRAASVELPLHIERVRLFRASARYYTFTPRSPLRVAVVPAEGAAPGALDGVRALVACRRGVRLDDPLPLATPRGTTLDVSGADVCTLALINTRVTGESSLLRVCAGSPDEPTLCEPAPPTPDAGAPADAPDGRADAVSAPPAAPPPGCACTARSPARAPRLLAALALAWGLTRRRRRW